MVHPVTPQMTTVLIAHCFERDSADPIGRLRPTGRDRRHTAPASHRPGVRQDLALFGRLVAEGEVARDHRQHELTNLVEKQNDLSGATPVATPDDQAGEQNGG